MWKFMKNYALEIYTVIAMLLIVCVALFMGELTVIQKFIVFRSQLGLHTCQKILRQHTFTPRCSSNSGLSSRRSIIIEN